MQATQTIPVVKSTTHRVINPDNDRSRRFSMPYFVHLRGDQSVGPLAECVQRSGEVKLYDDMTAREFLEKRLREIGVKQ